MRVLYSHRINSHDGQGVHITAIVDALRAAGHEVLVVGPSSYEHASFGGETPWVARVRAALPSALGELAELAYNFLAYWRLSRACRSFRPDLIYERYNLFYLAGVWIARHHKLRFFVEVNAPLADERQRHGALRLSNLAMFAERYVWRNADRLFVVTGVLKQCIAHCGINLAKIEVIPNGIDLTHFPVTSQNPGNPVVLGFVGFVREWHGLDAVITMLARKEASDLAFHVVGVGPALLALQAQAAALGVADRVRFLGLAAHETIPSVIATFDIALQPRAVAYASPLKIFEYMAAGRAIVAPDQPNIREILDHDRTALLFNPTEPDGLWRAICRLKANRVLRQTLGNAARAEIIERDYTWAGNARRIMQAASGPTIKSSFEIRSQSQ